MSSIPTIHTSQVEVSSADSTRGRRPDSPIGCVSRESLRSSKPIDGDCLIEDSWFRSERPAARFPLHVVKQLRQGIRKRWLRERRRRKVGRAYDMALEIARIVPPGSRLLDVGCGNGFIAHHLAAMINADVVGIDLDRTTEAVIDYRSFNGTNLPFPDESFDAVLFCYVLHHVQALEMVLSELRRALRSGGRVVIYEDIPETWWDGVVCAIHNRKWRHRTGRCTFYSAHEWRLWFRSAGFEIVQERRLSRCRNLAHPVRRRLFELVLSSER